jgi:hypothetical protein
VPRIHLFIELNNGSAKETGGAALRDDPQDCAPPAGLLHQHRIPFRSGIRVFTRMVGVCLHWFA